MKTTIIVRADHTGLGIQSRNWTRLLQPDRVVIINSQPFNGNEQYFEWYDDVPERVMVNGFIQTGHFQQILSKTDVLLTFEIPYNYNLFIQARLNRVKTILQNNWEFTDYLRQPLPLPDILMNHSYWNLDEQMKRWPNIATYCPTPLFIEDFAEIYEQNTNIVGKKRFIHSAGRGTYEDRNGTNDLLAAVKLIPLEIDFELVIHTQTTSVSDPVDTRITIDRSFIADEKEICRGYDAMILPRRYGGACLPMNEALASGVPVIMTDIDPNNKVLPEYWLVPAGKKTEFMARTMIDVYSADRIALAAKIAQFAVMDRKLLGGYKLMAREIAAKEFSSEVVADKWAGLMRKIGL